MKKIKIFALLLILTLTIVACSNNKNSEEETTTRGEVEVVKESENKLKEFKNLDDGGFYINNKGRVISPKEAEGKKILQWYFEPACPGCISLETNTNPYIKDIMGENTLIKYVPLSFIGKDNQKPDSLTYSDYLAGIILSMVENDPELVDEYISKVMDQVYINFHYEKNDLIPVFKSGYELIGGQKWDKIEEDIMTGVKITNDKTSRLAQDEEMKSKAPEGRLSTPLLYVEGSDSTLIFDPDDKDSLRPILEEAFK